MACAQVLQTTELLEMILLNMPCRDLLLSQRVNRTWRGTIQNSSKLKRALFLVPSGPVLRRFGRKRRIFENTSWSIVEKMDPNGELFRYAVNQKSPEAYSVTMNPLIARIFPIVISYQRIAHVMPAITSRKKNAMNRPEASWRRMLICQPPVSCIYTNLWGITAAESHCFADDIKPLGLEMCYFLPDRRAGIWKNETGLTISDLVVNYKRFHDGRTSNSPGRARFHDVFTWWRPRPEHVTAETIAADGKPYSWERDHSRLNVLPTLCTGEGAFLSSSWVPWTS